MSHNVPRSKFGTFSPNYLAYHVSIYRSKFATNLCIMAWFIYPIFIITFENIFDRIVPAVLFIMTTLELCAILRGTDQQLLFTTRVLQASLMTVCVAKTVLLWQELLTCPAQSPGDKLVKDSLNMINCTGSVAIFHNQHHAVLRATMSSYHVFVLLPILFLLHAIKVPVFIVPVFVLGCIDVVIASTYVPMTYLITASLSPMFAGMFLNCCFCCFVVSDHPTIRPFLELSNLTLFFFFLSFPSLF